MAEVDTHESDKELWLDAHHRAPAFTLKPGQTLTPKQRAWAIDKIQEDEEREKRDRHSD